MKITIVGGGTAGWMTAAYLVANRHPTDSITVIDKEVGTPIGVGEATILDFEPFMRKCGFRLEEWFPKVDATFKSGILFKNWNKQGNDIWHPFRHITPNNYCTQWDIWSLDQSKPFQTHALPMLKVSEAKKVDLTNIQYYSYHVDCSKLVIFLQDRVKDSIEIIRSGVKTVYKNENGIDKLLLEDGTLHESDIFVDCTGFASVLKTQDRVDISDRLFCNTAIASHVQYEDKETEMLPYAVSESVEHGWIWKIPVQSRLGSGMVFNRNVTDIDTAKDFFVNYWNGRVDKNKLKVIDWTPYYIKNFWEGNVVSIGLSGGFVEPLESTGLSIMRIGIEHLAKIVKQGYISEFNKNIYNATMINIYEDVVDFVNVHYSNSEVAGDFWDFVRKNYKKTLAAEYYENELVTEHKNFINHSTPTLDGKIFHAPNWFLWLIQLGYDISPYRSNPYVVVDYLNKEFLTGEEMQTLLSVDHLDAIKLINIKNV